MLTFYAIVIKLRYFVALNQPHKTATPRDFVPSTMPHNELCYIDRAIAKCLRTRVMTKCLP